jgi:hypothetical protein
MTASGGGVKKKKKKGYSPRAKQAHQDKQQSSDTWQNANRLLNNS